MKVKQILVLFFFVCFTLTSFSTHIVGGEIYYRYLGQNYYQVTLKVYRDCFNGKIGFDDPASLGIHNSIDDTVINLQLASPLITRLPVELNNPCFKPPTNV